MLDPMMLFLEVISNNRLSRTVGRMAEARVPGPLLRAAIRAYSKAYGVDFQEMAEPLEHYATFNEFFTRPLREGLRPICGGANTMASPVDGVLLNFGPVQGGRIEQIKGRDYTLEELLQDPDDAARYKNGRFATLYLSPKHYHRIHSPVTGTIVGYRHVPGRLYPVNQLALPRVKDLFTVNERLITFIDAGKQGLVVVAKVGATSVGSISVSYDDVRTNVGEGSRTVRYDDPKRIEKGDELGRFNLGSTVVLLVESDRWAFGGGLEPCTEVRMGQELMRLPK